MRVSIIALMFAIFCVGGAHAGMGVPLPIAGATGPVGLVIAVAGYIAYRIFRKQK